VSVQENSIVHSIEKYISTYMYILVAESAPTATKNKPPYSKIHGSRPMHEKKKEHGLRVSPMT
jgi:hypothetical protein